MREWPQARARSQVPIPDPWYPAVPEKLCKGGEVHHICASELSTPKLWCDRGRRWREGDARNWGWMQVVGNQDHACFITKGTGLGGKTLVMVAEPPAPHGLMTLGRSLLSLALRVSIFNTKGWTKPWFLLLLSFTKHVYNCVPIFDTWHVQLFNIFSQSTILL